MLLSESLASLKTFFSGRKPDFFYHITQSTKLDLKKNGANHTHVHVG